MFHLIFGSYNFISQLRILFLARHRWIFEFFSRTISYLTSRRHSLYLLCLSIGNADGVGSIRKDELYRASAVLRVVFYQVQLQRVKVLDHPDLQDGCRQVWNHDLLAKIIEEEVYSHGSHGIDV